MAMEGHVPELRVIPYFSSASEATTYLVYSSESTAAVLVDPVPLDAELYTIILNNDLTITHIFITHPEPYMRRALQTLNRVFDLQIVCGEKDVFGRENNCIVGEREIDAAGLLFTAIPALPHSRTSFFYRTDEIVFTGSIIHAGTIGETDSAYAEALLVATVKAYILTLDRKMLILPSIGPPSTVAAERDLSPYYRDL